MLGANGSAESLALSETLGAWAITEALIAWHSFGALGDGAIAVAEVLGAGAIAEARSPGATEALGAGAITEALSACANELLVVAQR